MKSSLESGFNWFMYTVEVHNISISPNNNPLTMRENSQRELCCEVNSNALPVPTITWYLGSSNITSPAEIYKKNITITGYRKNNNKTLECRATNNNKQPKSANTTLYIECMCNQIPLYLGTKKWKKNKTKNIIHLMRENKLMNALWYFCVKEAYQF